MNIGYACLTKGVLNTDFRSCLQKNASEEKLNDLIKYNLNSLENIIDYNIKNEIKLFRISSDLIPFGSSEVNQLPWWDLFQPQLKRIGEKIAGAQMRISMHPGQYTVLNSPNQEVVEKAIRDLHYHCKVLDSLDAGPECKIVLHIGGVYNDKKEAVKRFVSQYLLLDERVKQRLIIENDDKAYNIDDVLELGLGLKIPVVFDNLHNLLNPSDKIKDDIHWIRECRATWKKKDGTQKIHYSQQDLKKQPGSHSGTIRVDEFMAFIEKLNTKKIDIMLEVKDKNLSAVKCMNLIADGKDIKVLEEEWSRYKYAVLEHSPDAYQNLRDLLKKKEDYPVVPFYWFIEDALEKEIQPGQSINAAQHVWGYFGKEATDAERKGFLKCLDGYSTEKQMRPKMKNLLWKMAVKYRNDYLLDSYYFIM